MLLVTTGLPRIRAGVHSGVPDKKPEEWETHTLNKYSYWFGFAFSDRYLTCDGGSSPKRGQLCQTETVNGQKLYFWLIRRLMCPAGLLGLLRVPESCRGWVLESDIKDHPAVGAKGLEHNV